MRSSVGLLVIITLAAIPEASKADLLPISTNGIWTTFSDKFGVADVCGLQARIGDGKFTIWGATDRQGLLEVSLFKNAWQIRNVPVPVILSFSSGAVIKLTGSGNKDTMRFDVPQESVRIFLHFFTADEQMTVSFPEGRELPWILDLKGTTPAIVAIGQCVDAVRLTLPPPFRPPVPSSQVAGSFEGNATDLMQQSVNSVAAPGTQEPPPVPSTTDERQATGLTAEHAADQPTTQLSFATQEDNKALSPPNPPPLANNSGAPGETFWNLIGAGVGGFFVIIAIAGICLYFLPTIIASSRGIQNSGLLFLLNLIFGWTLVGWFGCILWSVLAESATQRALYRKLLREG